MAPEHPDQRQANRQLREWPEPQPAGQGVLEQGEIRGPDPTPSPITEQIGRGIGDPRQGGDGRHCSRARETPAAGPTIPARSSHGQKQAVEMRERGQGEDQAVGDGPLLTTPPPGQSHQQDQQGVALTFNRKANGIRTAEGTEQPNRETAPGITALHPSQAHNLGQHHSTTGEIGHPGEQTQRQRRPTEPTAPTPKEDVIQRWVGVLPQHPDQRGQIGLETFANAVKLIAPEPRGIDQQQRTKGKCNG